MKISQVIKKKHEKLITALVVVSNDKQNLHKTDKKKNHMHLETNHEHKRCSCGLGTVTDKIYA